MIISSYGGFGLTAADFIAMRAAGASFPMLTPVAMIPKVPITITAVDTSTPASLPICAGGQVLINGQCIALSKSDGMPGPEATPSSAMLKTSCEAAGKVWDNDHGTCLPKAYTDAMRAQADQVLDLSPSFFDRIPPAVLWAGALGAVALVVYRSRRTAPMQGYRRRRRKK